MSGASVVPWLKTLAPNAKRLQLTPSLSGVLQSRKLQQFPPRESIPMWEQDDEKAQAEFQRLLANNKEWAEQIKKEDPEYFEKNAQGQSPTYLWIGCADSRVPAETLTGLKCGEIFVHRNIANLVVNTDLSCLSVLTYAVEFLKVKHIVVCGHYECGGVKAATAMDQDFGVIEHWLRNIRDVRRLHATELNSIVDPHVRYRRLIELNVVEQCVNLFKTGVVQQQRIKTGYPRIHGLVYEIKDGHLKELNLDLIGYMKQYKDIYKLYS
eukprot:comp12128_c0_seq1/m.6864 comp12128_c0_seq1/g.6864  ORF comp12128_c0_seq1/g.6864 comp12128_c0_seq1/m.6864 type:complete len:267 (-) comp12128_c0_seq1:288-1088(-)